MINLAGIWIGEFGAKISVSLVNLNNYFIKLFYIERGGHVAAGFHCVLLSFWDFIPHLPVALSRVAHLLYRSFNSMSQ